MSDQEFVTVTATSSINVRFRKDIKIPKEMMDRVPEDDMWNEEVEKYIKEMQDYGDQHAMDFDESDVDLWDVTIVDDDSE